MVLEVQPQLCHWLALSHSPITGCLTHTLGQAVYLCLYMNKCTQTQRFTDLHTLRITQTPSCTRTIRCSPYHISSDLYRIHWHHINRLHKQTALHAPEEKKQHSHILQPSYTQIHKQTIKGEAKPTQSDHRSEESCCRSTALKTERSKQLSCWVQRLCDTAHLKKGSRVQVRGKSKPGSREFCSSEYI